MIGKIEGLETGTRKTPSQQLLSKLSRRNQAKQKRITQSAQLARTTNIFAGKDGAPRVVAVVPLTSDVDSASAIKSLNESVDVTDAVPENGSGMVKVFVERFKQNIAFCAVKRNLLEALDVCRAADFVVLIVSAKEEVDEYGELILRSIEGQGISNVVTVVQVCSIMAMRSGGMVLIRVRVLTALSLRRRDLRLLALSNPLSHISSPRSRKSIP